MVYLRKIIENKKTELLQQNNIEAVAYYYLSKKARLTFEKFNLSPNEQIALKGYKNESVTEQEVRNIISDPIVKQKDSIINIYTLAGLYLASKKEVENKFNERFNKATVKEKFFLAKIEPTFIEKLENSIALNNDPLSLLIKYILGVQSITEKELDNAIIGIIDNIADIQTLIILEDLEKRLLKIKYNNLDAVSLVKFILNNFSNAIKKITQDRRKDHKEFEINDEYDVQDILYVILKSVFPNLKIEDPCPKSGGKGTKIDLILREQGILIEVKMIKQSDYTEAKFIDQLKIDIESYHTCEWLETLICFIYDPYNKTKDLSNFKDLDGKREKNGKVFYVETIVVN